MPDAKIDSAIAAHRERFVTVGMFENALVLLHLVQDIEIKSSSEAQAGATTLGGEGRVGEMRPWRSDSRRAVDHHEPHTEIAERGERRVVG